MQGLRRRGRAVAAQREGGGALWYLSVASVSLRKNEGENEEHGKGRGGRSVQVVFGKSSRRWRCTGRQRKIEMCLTKEILGLGNTQSTQSLPLSILSISAFSSSLLIISITWRKQMHAQDVWLKAMTSSSALLVQGLCTSCIPQDDFITGQCYQCCLN